MPTRKINKKEIERFTLPSSEEATSSANDKKESLKASSFPDNTEGKVFWHTKKGKIWTSAFGLAILLALVVGSVMYRGATMTKSIPLSTFTEKPQISPTPTPKTIEISKYKIEILNGSGIQGKAAETKALLEQKGFTVISIGNSEPFKKTVIQTKKNVTKEFLEKLKNSLQKSYITSLTAELSETEKADIIVIIGKEN